MPYPNLFLHLQIIISFLQTKKCLAEVLQSIHIQCFKQNVVLSQQQLGLKSKSTFIFAFASNKILFYLGATAKLGDSLSDELVESSDEDDSALFAATKWAFAGLAFVVFAFVAVEVFSLWTTTFPDLAWTRLIGFAGTPCAGTGLTGFGVADFDDPSVVLDEFFFAADSGLFEEPKIEIY